LKYAMMIDVNRCSICYSCQVACKDEFVGNIYPPYSYTQTDLEEAWIKVSEIEKGKYPHSKVYPVPVLCMHCDKAPCIAACPVSGCIYRTSGGVVIIDPAKCNGCKACIDACPYGVILFNDDKNICQKCTLCHHRLDEGKEPACIDACPSGVFVFGDESKVVAEAKKRGARWMNPEYKTSPRIYYLGLPSPSLAGHVIDTQRLMDVTGASVTITGTKSGSAISLKTNVAGNFLAENLDKDGVYTVRIDHQGYSPRTINDVRIDIEYKHLGDIKLDKVS
jgi:tetrathionate reductase subunit B